MFKKTYGDVTVEVVEGVEKRGTCLCASKEGCTPIYMDHVGPMLPDGANAYMFGNKLIIVNRWAGMSDEERETVREGDIRLVFAPYRFIQAAVAIGGYGWSDVFFTLYHCSPQFNDEKLPVDKLIFIFADKSSGEIVADRCVELPNALAEFLRQSMVNTHERVFLDLIFDEQCIKPAQNDPNRDYCDVLYDLLWDFSKDTSRRFRAVPDTDNVPLGIYLGFNAAGEVTELEQHEE